MQLVELAIEDYEEIMALWRNTPGLGITSEDSREGIERFLRRNSGMSYCCRTEGRIIGTSLCGHDGRRGYIYHTAVAEGYRGEGIGKALVDRCLTALKKEGIIKCRLFVKADNELGKGFWDGSGWTMRKDILIYAKDI